MAAEFDNTHIHFLTDGPAEPRNNITYVDLFSFSQLIDLLVSRECFMCEKTAKQGRKCPIRKAILDVLKYEPWDAPHAPDDPCEFCGLSDIAVTK